MIFDHPFVPTHIGATFDQLGRLADSLLHEAYRTMPKLMAEDLEVAVTLLFFDDFEIEYADEDEGKKEMLASLDRLEKQIAHLRTMA